MENWRKLSQNYHQILLFNKSSDGKCKVTLLSHMVFALNSLFLLASVAQSDARLNSRMHD